ncbi:MAG: glycosyltransferase [Candidatus Xenobiia bacterium LiM19]
MKSLKVACISITGGDISGGFKKHLGNLIPRIASHHDIESVLCVAPHSIRFQDFFNPHPKIQFAGCAPFKIFNTNHDAELLRSLIEYSPDILFIPLARYLKYGNIPVVNMILNMEPCVYDNRKNPLIDVMKNIVQYHIARQAIKMSQRVIAVSKFVRDFMIDRWNIPTEKIGLVYPGAETLDEVNMRKPDALPVEWKDKFIFTIGTIRPARGLEDLIEAMNNLKSSTIKLVILGNASSTMKGYKSSLDRRIINLGLSDNILWLSSLSYEEMVWCYKNSSAFIMTSRVEACSNITIEAMSAGCISLSTQNPPMPEIFDDAALYYNAGNGKELADLIIRVLKLNESEKLLFRNKAIKRAASFSWDKAAIETIEQFKITCKAKT